MEERIIDGVYVYTKEEHDKLAGIEPGAQRNVQPDWNAVSGPAAILNRPAIPDTTGKADKVAGAVAGHIAVLDASGNLADSGKSASDFVVAGPFVVRSLLSGWIPWGNHYFPIVSRFGDIVSLSGVIYGTNTNQATTLFVVPEVFRPASLRVAYCVSSNNGEKTMETLTIQSDGQVNIDYSGLGGWKTGLKFLNFTYSIAGVE